MKKISKIIIVAFIMSVASTMAFAQVSVGISIGIAPPPLPVYVQPACPVDGYIWQPGYWAYDDNDGYYWVPGIWVAPPDPGLYWTPNYWGYDDGSYGFHAGYWGPTVGFYGGINYGFGYSGWGYGGGRWDGDHFRYNTAVVNVNRTVIHNTYIDRTVINNTYVNNHTSFNGPGGVTARPRPEELRAMNERHVAPTSNQMEHQQFAGHNRAQFASVNHGRPVAAAMNQVHGHPFTSTGQVANLDRANAAVRRLPPVNDMQNSNAARTAGRQFATGAATQRSTEDRARATGWAQQQRAAQVQQRASQQRVQAQQTQQRAVQAQQRAVQTQQRGQQQPVQQQRMQPQRMQPQPVQPQRMQPQPVQQQRMQPQRMQPQPRQAPGPAQQHEKRG